MRKSKFLSLVVASLVASQLYFSGLASADGLVKLTGAAKQEFVAKQLQAFYSGDKEVRKLFKPFVVPPDYVYEKSAVHGVRYERLAPKQKQTETVLIQMHGGAFVFPLSNSYRNYGLAQSLAAGKAEIYLLDYRLAPQYKHPAALEDAVTLYKALLAKGYEHKQIVFIGDSAGATLGLTTCLKLRELGLPQPKQIVLQSPWNMAENVLPSRFYNYTSDGVLGEGGSPLFGKEVNATSYAEASEFKNPLLSPLYAKSFKGLPPMLIQVGGAECLLDDAILLAGRAQLDGVQVKLSVYESMPHDFALLLPNMQDRADAFKEIKTFIKNGK